MKFDSRVVAHAGWEMLIMRAIFAWLILMSTPRLVPFTEQPHPNGIAHLVDLTFLASPEVLAVLRGIVFVALVFYVFGIGIFPALTIVCPLQIAWGSLENSQGAINHSFQPLALAALAQWGTAGYLAWKKFRQSGRFPPIADVEAHRALVHAAKVALVACYVTSAVSKFQRSEGEWLQRTPNLAAAITKTNASHYLNAFHPSNPLAEAAPKLIIEHPNLTRLFFGFGLALELFAFLALIGRLPAFAIGVALITMHETIAAVMRLHFPVFQWLSLVFLVNIPFAIVFMVRAAWSGLRRRASQ